MSSLSEIHKEILSAQLPNDEYVRLLKLFSYLGEEEQESLLELLREKPEILHKINLLIKEKELIFKSDDMSGWQELLDEEELLLKDVDD